MRKVAAVDRRHRRADRIPSSDLFSSRWISPRPQHPTSRHFIVSANQRAFVLTHRQKPGDSRYMDTAERQKKRRLCFIEDKTTDFISNRRNFSKENFQHNRKTENIGPKQVDFLSNSPYFSPTPHSFSGKAGIRWPRPLAFPRAQTCPNGHAPTHIAHSASLQSLPSPFTFTRNTLIIKRNKSEDKQRFNTSPVKATQALPSHLTLSSPKPYDQEVKK